MILYGLLSVLLLFTAAIVSNIESVQQTLNLSLEQAYVHVFISVEALIWIRSLAIVLLIVAHALRHVHPQSEQSERPGQAARASAQPLVLTPELVDALRAALAQVTVSEEDQTPKSLPSPQDEHPTSKDEQRVNSAQEAMREREDEQVMHEYEQGPNNAERVRAYLSIHPDATDRVLAEALTMSTSTANKWRKRLKISEVQGEQHS